MAVCMAGCTPDHMETVFINTDEMQSHEFRLRDMEVYAIHDCEPRTVPYSLFSGISEEKMAQTVTADKLILDRQWFNVNLNWKLFLVDTGMGELSTIMESEPTLRGAVNILLTHGHADHVGGLLSWKVPPEAKIYMSKKEIAYWQAPEQKDSPAAKMLALYEQQIVPFDFDTEVLPGVWARDAAGHTPGHTVFETEDILFVGDLLHCAALQFPRPEVCTSYDMDTAASVTMRKQWLTKAAESGKPIAGAHLPFPGVGTVCDDGNGGFTFTPLNR